VHRINLSLGDRLFWRSAPGHVEQFGGRARDWPAHVAAYLDRHAITDIVLLGEQREYHRAAIAAAHARGIAVTVTDFGYFRPDWITLERDGMGGDSRFPRDAAEIRRLAAGLPRADLTERLQDDFPRQARWDVLYHLANMLPWPFPHYRSHHLHHPLATYAGIGRRLLRRRAEYAEGARALEIATGRPYWVFAMQMETDFSIRAYSTYPDMDTPLARRCVPSRATRRRTRSAREGAPARPLPWKRWGRRIPAIADAAGVRGRVHDAHHGPLDVMLRGARGLVTVQQHRRAARADAGLPVDRARPRRLGTCRACRYQGPARPASGPRRGARPRAARRLPGRAAGDDTGARVFYAPEGRARAVAETVERLAAGRVGEYAPRLADWTVMPAS
jgi:capsular polysaccharide export protein